jgi:ABC-type dipeptide/oligopeptide/nickel transport system ATPase component
MEKTIKTKLSAYDYFIMYIKSRIKKNKNFLAAITGPTGSGKTYSSLRIAQDLDPEFNSERVVFTPNEFISLINHGNLKSGSVIVFDEAGVSLNNREWQSKSNNLIQYILQTFRHRNYIVLFTSPDFAFIDKASRKLFHSYMETSGINFEKKVCNIKPLMIQISQRTGDMYFKYLRMKSEGVGKARIGLIQVQLPNKNLIKDYEIKKTNFTKELNEKIEAEFTDEKKNAKDIKIEKLEKMKFRTVTGLRNTGRTWKEIAEFIGDTEGNIKEWYNRKKRDI